MKATPNNESFSGAESSEKQVARPAIERRIGKEAVRTVDFALKEATMLIDNLADLESDFAAQVQRQEERGGRMARKEFEIWEQDFADDWARHQGAIRHVNRGDESHTVISAHSEEALMNATHRFGDKVIEVQAGQFYEERSKALVDAIKASDTPDKEKDLAEVFAFTGNAMKHIDYKFTSIYGMDRQEALSYYRQRAAAHNNLIRNLNNINDLAEKYGTKPLTPRNFWTSNDNITDAAVQDRMSCDRNIVENYCRIAFTSAYERAEREWKRDFGRF